MLIIAFNAAVVGAETWVLARQLGQQANRETVDLAEDLVFTLRDKLRAEGLNAGPLLSWPSWDRFADAILLDRNFARAPDGSIQPRGVALNPVGRARRSATLDEQAVYSSIARSIEDGQALDAVEGGRVVPIVGPQGVFGACWYVLRPTTSGRELLLRYVLPAFAFSTILLSAGTFFALRRFVLDPVARLSAGASAVAEGNLHARVEAGASADELSSLIETFNRMTARVAGFNEELAREVERATAVARQAEATAMTQRRLAAMGELAAGIAHEINNPLGGLLNAVEALGREDTTPERRARYLKLLSGGLERIGRTVGQLLRFTPRSSHAERLALAGPVLDAVALVRHRAQALGVTLSVGDGQRASAEVELPPELGASLASLPAILGEAHEIAQAVLNLLVNALDALEERRGGARGGRVDVLLEAHPESVVIQVCDDGPGVEGEVLGRASDLFFTTKAPGKGSGLGLSIVHNVVSAHGGSLDIDSSPGEGFRVRISLPIAQEGA